MAVIKQRLNYKTEDGYRTIHLETSSDLVLREDGTSLESALNGLAVSIDSKAPIDHTHPAQTTVTGNAGTATKLQTVRTIDGVNFDGSVNISHYGTCSTEAATAAKVVACTGFVLAVGATIKVKFTVTNTAASPTLNVNGTGAKAIYYRGAAIAAGHLAANRTYEFVYNGTQFELVGDIDTDTNTTYVAATVAPKVAGTAAVGTSTKYAREDHVHPVQTAVTGNAGTATKLATARTFRVNLASTIAVSFDGSANVTPGVTGTLPVANGGTGVTTIAALKTALAVPTITASTTDLTAGTSALATGALYCVYE